MNSGPTASAPAPTTVPGTVRAAGAILALEGGIAALWGAVELVRAIIGSAESVRGAYGIAFWMIPMGAAILAGGVALMRGHRWGRTIGIMTNLVLCLVGASGAFAQGRPEIGLPIVAGGVVFLVLIFSPPSMRWIGEQRIPASPTPTDPGNSPPGSR